ncbi:hypothetical protein [Alteromonas macleodii]|jgi:hypothetical protein|uniref:hypothetical protein n=1 Tax=Alteromonas macleodii TaxID=28108 RepID=UPI0024A9124D|nr:hypothetical protein [Alteromonas macleodii]|tara:strand:+ start:1083 stop:1694 length:612 start_codon:yes stop_codon:yes gene_type:complete
MSNASILLNNRFSSYVVSKAESVLREYTMSNIERTFIEDNKRFWTSVAAQLEARTRRLSKISHNHLSYDTEKSLMVYERAKEIASERSFAGFGLYQVQNKNMQPIKRFYESLLKLSLNIADNKPKMNVVDSCMVILCKMVYPHIDGNRIDSQTLIRNAIADVNCADSMSHEEMQNWLICTQRLNKKLEKTSGNLLNPPALRLV